jgi:hypothetical protein
MEAMTEKELKLAHKRSFRNRPEIEASAKCGCFYCGKSFAPNEIANWVDDSQTALCPKCGIDAVLGSGSGLSISKQVLDEMNGYWF